MKSTIYIEGSYIEVVTCDTEDLSFTTHPGFVSVVSREDGEVFHYPLHRVRFVKSEIAAEVPSPPPPLQELAR